MARTVMEDTFTSNTSGPWRQAPDLGVILTTTAKLTLSSGSGTATVQLEGSNNGTDAYAVGTAISLTGTSPQLGNKVNVQFSYAMYRHTVSGLTGTGASCLVDTCAGS